MNSEQIQEILLSEGIQPETVIHNNENRIQLRFEMNERLNRAVKQIKGCRWSRTMNAWHIPRDKKLLISLIEKLRHDDTVSVKTNGGTRA